MANVLYFAHISRNYKKVVSPLRDGCSSYPEKMWVDRSFVDYTLKLYKKDVELKEESAKWDADYRETKSLMAAVKTPIEVRWEVSTEDFKVVIEQDDTFELVDEFNFDSPENDFKFGDIMWMSVRKGMSTNKSYGVGHKVTYNVPIFKETARGYKAYADVNGSADEFIADIEDVFSLCNID
jgi:hypothetical protein